MKATQIFGMYLGQMVKCKRYIDDNGNTEFLGEYEYKLEGINTGDNYEYVIADNDEFEFEDCQLILKPIAEMSEGDRKEFAEISNQKFVKTEHFFDLHKYMVKCFEFYISHGYALDDAWFEQGIAIRESEVKQ